jgi:hypothetical protein
MTTTAIVPQLEGPAERLADVARAIVRHVRRRPLSAVGVAVAAGFVIGGGLSFRAGRTAITAVGRHVLRELLKQLV